MRIVLYPFILLVALYIPLELYGQQTTFRVGQELEPPKVTTWIKNAPADSSLRGKTLIIDFWATWCGPCLGAVPHFNQLIAELEDREHLLFISITDEPASKTRRTLEVVDFHSAVASMHGFSTLREFGINNIPCVLILNPQGKLLWQGLPRALTTSKVKDLLDNGRLNNPRLREESTPGPTTTADLLADSLRALTKASEPQRTLFLQAVEPGKAAMFSRIPGHYFGRSAPLAKHLSNLLGLAKSRIVLPAELEQQHYMLLYINRLESTREGFLADMLEQISAELGLNYHYEDKVTASYLVTVRDSTRLQPNDGMLSRSSSSGRVITLTNVTMSSLMLNLEQATGIAFTDATDLQGGFDFVIDTSDEAAIRKGLTSYGLQLEAQQTALKQLIFSKKSK